MESKWKMLAFFLLLLITFMATTGDATTVEEVKELLKPGTLEKRSGDNKCSAGRVCGTDRGFGHCASPEDLVRVIQDDKKPDELTAWIANWNDNAEGYYRQKGLTGSECKSGECKIQKVQPSGILIPVCEGDSSSSSKMVAGSLFILTTLLLLAQ